MLPVRRRRRLRQQSWGVNCRCRTPRRRAARSLHRMRALRRLWNFSQASEFVASLGWASQAHGENARSRVANSCRSSLPNFTITFLAGTNRRHCWNGSATTCTRGATLTPVSGAGARSWRLANRLNCNAVSISQEGAAAVPPQSGGSGIGQEILDGFADLHKLIETRRLGDELDNSEVLEQRLVSPGPGRTPHAHWNTAKVSGGLDLAQDVFAGIFGQVQVHQDQVWNCRIRIGTLPADESEGLAAVQQVNQFKAEIMLIQGPIEKEDVRGVVFNDEDPYYGSTQNVFQAHSPRPPSPAAFYHSTVDGGAVCGDTSL